MFSYKQTNLILNVTKGFLKHNFCNSVSKQQFKNYEYFLFLDFEATCDKKRKMEQEIIEFPCLKVNAKTLVEEGRFHHYVRPVVNPNLSVFCIELTGILQEVVNLSPTFPEVYRLFEEWREKEGLTADNSLYVTSGDWDLGSMIKVQCAISNLFRPSHMYEWADIKKVFANNSNTFFNSFADILRFYGLEFEGRRHSGIDDCINMYRVAKIMIKEGIEFVPTAKIINSKVYNVSNGYPKVNDLNQTKKSIK